MVPDLPLFLICLPTTHEHPPVVQEQDIHPFYRQANRGLWCLMNRPSLWSMSAGEALIVVGKPPNDI